MEKGSCNHRYKKLDQGSPISFLGYQAEGHDIAGGDGGVPATPATVQISSLSGDLVCPKPFVLH